MHAVRIVRERPDYRVLIDLLYGKGRDVDTDGDSYNPASRDWTDLYIKDRESEDPFIEVFEPEGKEGVFEVISESKCLEKICALYLYLYCGDSLHVNGKLVGEAEIKALREKYAAELDRAKRSIWHQSTIEKPYPNVA